MGKNLFNSVQLQDTPSNVFDLSHEVKLSFNMGELIPVMCVEVNPGDKFNVSSETLLKLAPLVSPMMHRCKMAIDYFFVPNRILWDGWEKFITPDDPAGAPEFPFIDMYNDGTDNRWTRLADYLGIPEPPLDPTGFKYEDISAIPFAAYQRIYFEYYNDQTLGIQEPWSLTDGRQTNNPVVQTGTWDATFGALRRRAWEHDYFTSALPYAAAGTSVNIPLADVELKDNWDNSGNRPFFQQPGGGTPLDGALSNDGTGANAGQILIAGNGPNAYDPNGSLGVGASSINDLRRASKLQEWLERLALGGRRYKETIKAFFNVNTGDDRLQRPEMIMRQTSPVVVGEVLNTTGTTDAPQGERAGTAMGYLSGQSATYFAREHGYIMAIMSVLPDTAYQQGIPKHFLKINDALEYYFPQFANIGEQEIKNKELYAYLRVSNTNDPGDLTFGYIPRYAEYKFENNRVAGDFRSSLDFWHMGRKFTSLPVLNQSFVESDPTHRVFAVDTPTVQKLYCQVYHRIRAVRKMPKYGTGRL